MTVLVLGYPGVSLMSSYTWISHLFKFLFYFKLSRDIPSIFALSWDITGYAGISHQNWDVPGFVGTSHMLCKFLQTSTGITQDNLVADAARRMPASATPSPSLLQSGDMPT